FAALTPAPLMLDEGIADEADERGEGKGLLVASSAMSVVEVFEEGLMGRVSQEQERGLSQWGPLQRGAIEPVHAIASSGLGIEHSPKKNRCNHLREAQMVTAVGRGSCRACPGGSA